MNLQPPPDPSLIRFSRYPVRLLFAAYLMLFGYVFWHQRLCLLLSLPSRHPFMLPAFGKTGLLLALILEALWTIYALCLSLLCRRRLDRKIGYALFEACEKLFREMRIELYFALFFTLVLVLCSTRLRHSPEIGILVLVQILPLSLCAYHGFFRRTFRKWPNFVLSVSVCLQYLAWAALPYPTRSLFGFLDGSGYNAIISQLTSYLAGGTLLASLGAMAFDSVKEKYSSELEKNDAASPVRKSTRIRLLLHTPCSRFPQLSVCILLYACICCGSVLLSLSAPGSSQQAEGAIVPSLSFYPGLLGICAGFVGIAAHFIISEESLLKAEYAYIYLCACRLTEADVRNQSVPWQDYCQVVAHVYSSHSGILSDDHDCHILWFPTLKQLKQRFSLCDSRLFADILSAQSEISPKTDPDALPDSLCIAADTRDYLTKEPEGSIPQRLFDTLHYAAWLFFKDTKKWENHLRFLPHTLEEIIAILTLDLFHMLLRQKSTAVPHCRAAAFCSQCGENPGCADAFARRAELLLSYPFLVRECMKKRWKDTDISIPDDLAGYYSGLANTPPEGTADMQQLKTVHSRWLSSLGALLENAKDTMRVPIHQILSEVYRKAGENREVPGNKRILALPAQADSVLQILLQRVLRRCHDHCLSEADALRLPDLVSG